MCAESGLYRSLIAEMQFHGLEEPSRKGLVPRFQIGKILGTHESILVREYESSTSGFLRDRGIICRRHLNWDLE